MRIDDNLIRRLTIENVPGELEDEDSRFDDPEYAQWVNEHKMTIDDLDEMFRKITA